MENLIIFKPLVEINLWMHYLYNKSHATKQNLSKLFMKYLKHFS